MELPRDHPQRRDALEARFAEPFGPPGRGTVPATRGELHITTGTAVEGVHFARPAFSWQDVGFKALALGLNRLAALGVAPAWFVVAIAAPSSLRPSCARRMAAGMSELAQRGRIAFAGVSFSPAQSLSIAVTAAGWTPKGKALGLLGAKVSDVLFVSGTLGEARLGLAVLTAELPEPLGGRERTRKRSKADAGAPRWQRALPFDPEVARRGRSLPRPNGVELTLDRAIRRQLRPEIRLGLGQLARRYASAATEVNEGLKEDLGRLAGKSQVMLQVDPALLPTSTTLRGVQSLWAAARIWAWTGSDDGELAFTIPRESAESFERACRREGYRVTRIGHCVRGSGVTLLPNEVSDGGIEPPHLGAPDPE